MTKKHKPKQDGGLSAFESKLLGRVRNANVRLQKAKSINELRPELTFRQVKIHLEPRTVTGAEIKEVRRRLKVSQAIFAMFIQVPVRTLQEWEQGRSEVSGCAARLLGEMLHNPEYWASRFDETVETAT